MDDYDEHQMKFLSEINYISHVEVKGEVTIPENSSDSESTLSDNEKGSNIKQEECLICCKYHSMFIILKNHDCDSVDEGRTCNFCSEITHWSKCFKDHKESHRQEGESESSSDSTTSDRDENEGKCKVCLKYEFMIPLLKSHICNLDVDKKCRNCSEVMQWIECYKKHSDTHNNTDSFTKSMEEDSSDSTSSDNEEMQKVLVQLGKKGGKSCGVCVKYQVMFIILHENHMCNGFNKKCGNCEEIFHWYQCFERHKSTHSTTELKSDGKKTVSNLLHFGRKFDCGICLKLNSIVTNLVKNHWCIENKSCPFCQEISYWLSCLKNHKRSELQTSYSSETEELDALRNFVPELNCSICCKFRMTILNLGDHVCLGRGKEKCELCLELSFWCRNFKNHQEYHNKHLLSFKNFPSCSNCGKRFSSEKMLNVHKSYCRSSYFICEICHQKFSSLYCLKRHRIFQFCSSPLNSMGNQCNVYKKVFSNAIRLKNHEEFHDDYKLYKCTKCFLQFKSQLCLKKHKGIHR